MDWAAEFLDGPHQSGDLVLPEREVGDRVHRGQRQDQDLEDGWQLLVEIGLEIYIGDFYLESRILQNSVRKCWNNKENLALKKFRIEIEVGQEKGVSILLPAKNFRHKISFHVNFFYHLVEFVKSKSEMQDCLAVYCQMCPKLEERSCTKTFKS